jgi:hypothetical protein
MKGVSTRVKDILQRFKLALLAFAFIISVLFICAPPVRAEESEMNSIDCVQALTPLWDKLAVLNAQEVESLVNISKDLNQALFLGINGNQPVLTVQQQTVLEAKFGLSYSGLLQSQVFEIYVNTHQSDGVGGYEGFVKAVSPSNRDITYLAELYETLRNSLPLSFRLEMNSTWNWGECERIEFFLQLLNTIKIDQAGNISCPQFDALVEQYIINVSNITEQDLIDIGFDCQLFHNAFIQLTDEEQEILNDILIEMGISGPIIKGNVFLEKVYADDPEPDHAGTVVNVKKGNNIMASAVSLSNGSYSVCPPSADSYNVSFDRPDGSWKEEIRPVTIGDGEVVELPDVILRLGDMDDDGVIDIFDILWAAARMGLDPNTNPEANKADVNNDEEVDIFDLLRVAQNMGL